jgi:superfamily II DNA helicase RecQ/very-short-patch-repair endonuclease
MSAGTWEREELKTMQLQAGYFLPSVKQRLLETGQHIYNIEPKITGLLTHLCYFELETDSDLSANKPHLEPLIAVANNIISRGLPTFPSIYIEEILSNTFQFTKKSIDDIGKIHYSWIPQTIEFNQLYAALHIIEPRLNRDNLLWNAPNSWENLGSDYEEYFLYQVIPNEIGDYFIQLLEPQRSFTSIINHQTDFSQQRVDFSIEFPYLIINKKGLIIEIDGSQHETDQQQVYLDRQRDNAADNADWARTLRLKTSDFANLVPKLKRLQNLVKNDYFQRSRDNYQKPLYQTEFGLDALQLLLTPIAIARIQKTLIELMLNGDLDLTALRWEIVILERDVPCANLAIEDFQQLFSQLFLLEGQNRQLPSIHLQVFVSEEFKNAKLNQAYPVKTLTDITDDITCDVLIDIAILQRVGFTKKDTRIHCQHFATIRSAHAPTSKRVFYTSDLIQYRQIVHKRNNETYDIIPEAKQALTYFLQNLFRKEQFRQGQLEILNKALQCQSVIGLLPTGGGKSLTYQLAVCLQPGIALIIDPIKSLMQDQSENLRKHQIDACVVINSSLNIWEKELATDKLIHAEVLFAFISPERLQIQSFRDTLTQMYHQQNYFSYCVIDEVHCVSEWGHDFRTAYLRLGNNAIRFCQTKNIPSIPLIGLTATASFDVLSDIQRELSANQTYRLGEDAIIRFETIHRQELQFEIIKVETTGWVNKENIGLAKQDKLRQLLKTVPQTMAQYNSMSDNQQIALANFEPNWFFHEDCTYAGLIFCPHRSGPFGVTDQYKKSGRKLQGVYDKLIGSLADLQVGTFIGADEANKAVETDSMRSQADFINNKLNLLVATKAFGMGIDKSNIRFTVHINYPNSIESFVQEAGRAGRDRKLAICYLLFNDQSIWTKGEMIEVDKDILLHFHRRAFKGERKEKSILYHNFLNTIIYPATESIPGIEKRLAEIAVGEKITPAIIVPFTDGKDKQDKTDKEKAIYRLSTIGVIDDYTIDFHSKTFVLDITKKADDTYKEYLLRYLKTYYSDARASVELQKVNNYRGETILQKCLGFLIDFVYQEVVKKRLEAINTMKMACQIGLKANGNQAFSEFIDLYFHAKYARKNYLVNGNNYSLTDRTEEGKTQNLQWVWEFIEVINVDKTGSQLDNLKHLRGACLRLLVDNPDNACLLLLKAFALFILEPANDSLFKEAKDNFTKGFLFFQQTQGLSIREYISSIFRYQNELEKYQTSNKPIIAAEINFLYVKAQTTWLEQFNHHFLADYESFYSQ